MTVSEELIQQIGQMSDDLATRDYDTLLLYAIYEQETIASGIFVRAKKDKEVYYIPPSGELSMLCYDLRKQMEIEKSPWVLMEYTIKGDQFNIDYKYDDGSLSGIDEPDFRKQLLEKHFGSTLVIYPK